MKLHPSSLATRITIGVLAMVAASAAMLLFVESAHLRNHHLNERRIDLEYDLQAEELLLNRTIDTLRRDTLFMANTPPVSGIMRATLNGGYDARDGDALAKWEKRMQGIFSAFLTAHPEYHKVRYIGVADGGREIVRVDNRAGKIEVMLPSGLQAKGDRDYFRNTSGLREGQVYLSEFNLNQERGVIEQPNRPTLRAVTPVFTPSGEMFGMVAVSMNAGSVLKSAVNDPSGAEDYITNESGQYLVHPDTRQAFQFEPGSKNKIAADFPFIQKMFDPQMPDYLPLQAVPTKSDGSLFAARRVHFDPDNPQRFLLVMDYLPGAVVAQQVASISTRILFYEFMAMLLVGAIALFALRRAFSPLKQITAAADKIAAGAQYTRLPQTGSGEIGSLVGALNIMLSSLTQREQLLRESESRLNFLVLNSPVTIYTCALTAPFCATYISPNVMLTFGYKPEQFTARSEFWLENIHPEDRKRVLDNLPQLFEHGAYQHDYRFRVSDGGYRWVYDELRLIRNEAGKATEIIGYWVDITARKHAEHQLQELGMHMQSVTEKERTRIARELHDELGQSMSALRFDLKWLDENMDTRRKDVHEKLQGINDLVGRTVDSIRRISEDLRPGMLDDLGLAAAIECHVNKFSEQSGIACDLSMSHADFDLDDQVATALFRLVQEALTNVARHSGANHVIIRVQEIEDKILLIVQDNGCGLSPTQNTHKKTYGLLGMRERVKMLGGTLDVFNEKGFGVRIEACVQKHARGNQ